MAILTKQFKSTNVLKCYTLVLHTESTAAHNKHWHTWYTGMTILTPAADPTQSQWVRVAL